MIIFINDHPLTVLGKKELSALDTSHFDKIVDARLTKIPSITFTGHLLIINVTEAASLQVLEAVQNKLSDQLLSVTLGCADRSLIEEKIKSQFSIVKASGGVVVKNDRYLLIYRRKHWDLPKGKLDKGERSRPAAVREIEEETGVRTALRDKICTTWHTYNDNGNKILKRTKWYLADCLDDSRMAPQVEEDIEKIEWLTAREAEALLVRSYSSIRFVFDCLKKGTKAAPGR